VGEVGRDLLQKGAAILLGYGYSGKESEDDRITSHWRKFITGGPRADIALSHERNTK
jgi:hypothetical protein